MSHSSKQKIVYLIFLLLCAGAGDAQQSTEQTASNNAGAPAVTPPASANVTTTGGTNGMIPLFNGTSTVVNSIIEQYNGGIGIGRPPAATLDVNGKSIFRGGMVISRSGDATTSAGTNSSPLQLQTSVYNTVNKINLLPYFQFQTEPVGNNTGSTGATLNFLYYTGVGCCPAETGLYINPNGTIHFSPTQTFPIAAGPPGPVGPAGPQGPSGPQGPAGQGGVLTLPYSGSGDGGYKAALSVTNSGTSAGPGITTTGSQGGDGLNAIGGDSSTNYNSLGGAGANIYGGAGNGDGSLAGYGAYIIGGNGGMAGTGGVGLYVAGGDAFASGAAGTGLVAVSYAPAPAGEFDGDVTINGNISKSGGSFKIDHPLDPANKYLSHSFVESPDMMNIYNGNVVTDGSGYAVVTLPEWFESLNRDFRYQLTTIGAFAQATVASEIRAGQFTIRTDRPNVKISWQVTGVRQDAWANAHRIPIEEDKPEVEKGHYTHPELFGHSGEPSIAEARHPRPKGLPKRSLPNNQ